MRTFYIFKIKREMKVLLKETPYNLFKILENLYCYSNIDIGVSFNIYTTVLDTFDKEDLNNRINSLFQNYKYYSNELDVHYIYNKYRPENTTLRVYKSHLLLKSDIYKPTLLVNYLMSDNLFVCDFKNKDYFWLDDYSNIKN